MNMAILFRKEQKKSPFAEALQELIKSEGESLILSTGFIAYNTSLNDLIVDAASNNLVKEVIIVAGYIEPEMGRMPIREYHNHIRSEYRNFTDQLKALQVTIKNQSKIQEIKERLSEIANEHNVNSKNNLLSLLSVNNINSLYHTHLKNNGAPPSEFDNKTIEYWEYIKENIIDMAKGKHCNYCKLEVFIISLFYKLFVNNNPDVSVRIVFIPETKDIKWHSKVALKVNTTEDKPLSALVGSSNLSTANLPFPDGSFYSNFTYECDVYINSNKINLSATDQDFSVIPVETKLHSIDGILDSIYKGVKDFL